MEYPQHLPAPSLIVSPASPIVFYRISPKTHQAGYGRFRPNKRDYDLWRGYYRGGWQPSYPPLIRRAPYTQQKNSQSESTQDSLITLSCIVKFSRLLRSVEPALMSQSASRGYRSHDPYGL